MKNREFDAAIWSTSPEFDVQADGATGIASFKSGRGISLEIPLGSLLGSAYGGAVFGRGELDRAYGLSQSGDRITILDLHGSGSFNSAGFVKEHWSGQSALVSRHAFFAEDPIVLSATIALDGLFEWVGHNPVNGVSHYDLEGHWLDTTYSASSDSLQETLLYASPVVGVYLCPRISDAGGSIPRKTLALTGDYELTFRFAGDLPRLHDAMFGVVLQFRDLLSLLMGYRAEILEVTFTSPEVDGKISYYAPLVEASAENRPRNAYREMPFPYSEVAETLQAMAERWFALEPDARRASRTILGLLTYEHDSWLDSKFVALASAFEALSRVGHKTEELDEGEFQRRLACVESSIADNKVLGWAKRKLQYANYVAAGSLANSTLEDLSPLSTWLVPDVERFKTDHRVSRNAYVHQNEDVGNGVCLEGSRLFDHTTAVFFLTYGKLMSLLGVAPERFVDRLKQSSYRSFILQRTRKMYARESD